MGIVPPLTYQEKVSWLLEACLATFEHNSVAPWSLTKPAPDRMAKAGFFPRDIAFRTEIEDGGKQIRDDTTTCLECGVEVVDWNKDDDPIRAHVDACEEAGRACAILDHFIADNLRNDEDERGGGQKIKTKASKPGMAKSRASVQAIGGNGVARNHNREDNMELARSECKALSRRLDSHHRAS